MSPRNGAEDIDHRHYGKTKCQTDASNPNLSIREIVSIIAPVPANTITNVPMYSAKSVLYVLLNRKNSYLLKKGVNSAGKFFSYFFVTGAHSFFMAKHQVAGTPSRTLQKLENSETGHVA
ncbi:hypothetical protein L0222_05575 [bacterium]|nr:hypothetical protein [bacterium]